MPSRWLPWPVKRKAVRPSTAGAAARSATRIRRPLRWRPAAHHHGAVRQCGPSDCQGPAASPPGPAGRRRTRRSLSACAAAPPRCARTAAAARPASARPVGPRPSAGGCSRMTWALVPLMPNEDTPARRGRPVSGHGIASVSSSTAPADQSTCGVGSSTCRVLGQHAVPHRHDHLDDPADAGGGLGVADVRLERAEPQRPSGRSLAVGGEQRPGPRSGRRAWCRCRGPRPRRRPRRSGRALASAWRMTRCWEGPLGAVRPLLAPSWLTAVPRITAEDPVAVALGVGEPLQQEQAGALGPAGAVRASAENALHRPSADRPRCRLNSTNRLGRGHHGHAAGQRQRALAAPQRLRRQVHGDQRGGAGGVDGDGRPLRPKV